MRPTGRRDDVRLHDILILIITANADLLGMVWWEGARGKRYGSKLGKIHEIIVMIIKHLLQKFNATRLVDNREKKTPYLKFLNIILIFTRS